MKSSKKSALILVAHGSKLAGFQRDMEKVAAALRSQKAIGDISCAYLELNEPSIPTAIDRAVSKGAAAVFVLPYFLLRGRHTQEDIPRIVLKARRRHKGTKIVLCPYLGFDKKIVEMVQEKIGNSLS